MVAAGWDGRCDRANANPNEQLVVVAPRDGFAARLIAMVDADRLLSLFETRAAALQSIRHHEHPDGLASRLNRQCRPGRPLGAVWAVLRERVCVASRPLSVQ
jgi:hypothetical protein